MFQSYCYHVMSVLSVENMVLCMQKLMQTQCCCRKKDRSCEELGHLELGHCLKFRVRKFLKMQAL